MSADLIVTGGTIATAEEVFRGNIVVNDGVIHEVQRGDVPVPQNAASQVIDARGRTVIPGGIDVHTHFEQPGPSSYREDFFTGTRSCAAGGVTTTLEHPLSRPPVRDSATFDAKLAVADAESVIDFGLWGALIPGYMDKLDEMRRRGAVAFKAFMSEPGADYPMTSDGYLLTGMQAAARLGVLIGLHAESEALTLYFTEAMRDAGRTDARAISEGRPPVAELEAINRAIFFARQTGARIHIVHMSIPAGASMIEEARRTGVDVSCETCPHYLHFDWSALDRLGGYAKCKPPVRSPDQVEALWQAVLAGKVDFIASDHAPYTRAEKEAGSVWDAPWGIPGAQTMLPLLISDGLIGRGWDLPSFVRFTSTHAAQRFGIYPQKGAIAVGSDADLTIIDLEASWTIRESDLFSKHGFSPYVGETLQGRIERTIVRGCTVNENGRIVVPAGYGRLVTPVERNAAWTTVPQASSAP